MTLDFEEALEKLRQGYTAKFPARIKEVQSLIGDVAGEMSLSPDQARSAGTLERLSGLAHRLAGSGATFGFPRVSKKARQLEARCEARLRGETVAPGALAETADELIEVMRHAVEGNRSAAAPAAQPDPSLTVSPSYRILVVDDDESVAAYNKAVLESAGMEALALSDAEQVLETLAILKPHLILLDLQMPGVSGQQLAALIGGQESSRRIPIIFLSGEEDAAKRRLAMGMGERFLPKPVDKETLIRAVTRAIEKSRS